MHLTTQHQKLKTKLTGLKEETDHSTLIFEDFPNISLSIIDTHLIYIFLSKHCFSWIPYTLACCIIHPFISEYFLMFLGISSLTHWYLVVCSPPIKIYWDLFYDFVCDIYYMWRMFHVPLSKLCICCYCLGCSIDIC